jgi:hypothetical protein
MKGAAVMFSKWNHMPPLAKWGSLMGVVMITFLGVRIFMGRGKSHEASYETYETSKPEIAVGD